MLYPLTQFDLAFLITAFSITILGMFSVSVYFSNPREKLNKIFLILSIFVIFWAISNFLYNQPNIGNFALWLLRIHIVFSVWYTFFTFAFFYLVFVNKKFSNYIKIYLPIIGVIISLLALTPLMFEKIISFSPTGRVEVVKTNPLTTLFGLYIGSLFIGFLIMSFKRIFEKPVILKNKIIYILIATGFIATFIFHIIFNLILPNIFKISEYTLYSPIFTIIFIVLTGIAIFKYHFINVRVFLTEIFVTILIFLSIFQLMSRGLDVNLIVKFLIFILVFIFGIILIRSIHREIEQREELEKLNKELDRLNRIKSEFLSIASHQIRSPMINIRGFVDLLINGTYGELPQEAITTLKKIEKNIQTEIDLVNNLLDLRKIEEGKMDYEFINFDLISEIKNVCEFYAIRAKEKNINLQCDLPSSILIKGDKEKLVQVINNLVDNAIKYTDQGCVEIKVQDLDDKVLISVKDTGRGIKKENLEKIFEAFSRGKEIEKEILGTGLGLYIAKNIINAHNGRIWAESEGLGKGSTFYIELPKSL